MRLPARLVATYCLTSALAFADNWRGFLVDSKCYAAEERNVNPTDTSTAVDRDRADEIRYCSPKAKTRFFAIVLSDGRWLELDSGGNAKAGELLQRVRAKSMFEADVVGELNGNVVNLESIAAAK